MKKQSRVLITSALPYANGSLHFGHIAGAYLPGDCYARFERLMGKDVLYVCGSDEHGVAITLSADLAKRSPQEHVDYYNKEIKEFFKKLNMSFNYYGRTTSASHADLTQEFFRSLEEKGYIESKTEDHLFSEKENRFLADRYVVGTCPKCGFEEARGDECQRCASSYEATDLKNPRSKLTGSPLIKKPSEHLYLRFDLFKDQLKSWIQSKKWKESVTHFAMSYIEDLKMRAITRDSQWGVPVPGMPGKVFYVWFDAPIGYISIAKAWDCKKWEDFWLDPDTTLVHFIGKDNIPFHAVFFPAMLMGQDLPYKLPDEIPANEFFMLEGKQFSKSDGWTIDMEDFFSKYTSDQARYAIAANAPENSDSEFTWKDFQSRCNSELLGKFGNFVHRVFTFTAKHFGEVPEKGEFNSQDRDFIEAIQHLVDEAQNAYAHFHLRKVTQILMELSQAGNAYFEHKKPWAMAKDSELRASLGTVLNNCIQCIKALCIIASPIIPESAQKIWKNLGFSDSLEKGSWREISKSEIKAGTILGESTPLFRKIEDEEIMEQTKKLEETKKLPIREKGDVESLKELITFDEFGKIDLRVGQVIDAIKVPKSKKLLKLQVDLGFEKRTIVSGIALHYEPEILLGKKVIVVANLKPAKLMGIESSGMILAGGNGEILELPLIDNLPLGSAVC